MIVLSIGTTHPWNVAGVGRDIVVGSEFGVRVFTAIAAVSAQDRRGVARAARGSRRDSAAQLAALPWDAAGAVRVGALPTPAACRAVAAALRLGLAPAVVDPVFAASARRRALPTRPRDVAVRDELASSQRRAHAELSKRRRFLLGIRSTRETIGDAAVGLQRARRRAPCCVKGGHLEGDPVDALAIASGVETLLRAAHRRLDARNRLHAGDGAGVRTRRRHADRARGRRAARAYVRAEIARHYAPSSAAE